MYQAKNLTWKQERFVSEYLLSGHAAEAVRELEDSGLILVERLPGKNPIVQIQGEHRHDGNYSKLSNRTPTR